MLKIVNEQGKDKPVITCDWCQERIDDARKGNYQWHMGPHGPLDGHLYFTHKTCCHAFETSNQSDDWTWGAIELEMLPVFLAHNLRLSQKHARETARVYAEMNTIE